MTDLAFQKRVNKDLEKFFERKQEEAVIQHKRTGLLVKQIADLTLRGGDRQRPYFCYLGYKTTKSVILGSEATPESGFWTSQNDKLNEIMPVLLALELFHSFALIHDDLMDEGDMRRGGPTIYAYFTQNLRTEGPADKLARSLAILAGDLCAQWAQELFDRITPPNPLLVRGGEGELRGLFNNLREEVMYGQVSDTWGMKGAQPDQIRQMYRHKSGNYSVTKPLVLGAMLGGSSEELIDKLTEYGEAVGLAFQLKDDLLDIFGQATKTGKQPGHDIRDGKWTLLIALTYSRLKLKDKQKLEDLLGKQSLSLQDINWVRERMTSTGTKVEIETEMRVLTEQAKAIVDNLPEKAKLKQIADFMMVRQT